MESASKKKTKNNYKLIILAFAEIITTNYLSNQKSTSNLGTPCDNIISSHIWIHSFKLFQCELFTL